MPQRQIQLPISQTQSQKRHLALDIESLHKTKVTKQPSENSPGSSQTPQKCSSPDFYKEGQIHESTLAMKAISVLGEQDQNEVEELDTLNQIKFDHSGEIMSVGDNAGRLIFF